jgi:uncharacterized protein (DUF58 family)
MVNAIVQGLTWPVRAPLGRVTTRVQGRFQAWFQARLRFTDQVTLTQRNVYILPTRAGLMFGLTLAVLLLASINYQLSLGYLLTFLLAGSGLAGIHVTHANLRGLTLRLKHAHNGAVGDACRVELVLSHSHKRARVGLGVAFWQAAGSPQAEPDWVWADVPSHGECPVDLSFQPQQRGRVRVPTLTVETRYPLGLFRVWTIWRPAFEVLVWPKPEHPAPPLPAAEAAGLAAHQAVHSRTGEYDGVRAYRRGDPMKLVVWRKAAKAGDAEMATELVSRDNQSLQRQDLWLDEADCPQAQREARLSRLAAWVDKAARADVAWGLRLPGLTLPPASGEAQRLACLEALALA